MFDGGSMGWSDDPEGKYPAKTNSHKKTAYDDVQDGLASSWNRPKLGVILLEKPNMFIFH